MADTQRKLLITHANVVDVRGGNVLREHAILISGRVIEAVASAADFPAVADCDQVDASGKFVIPGLWDMHAHATQSYLPLFIANGVTQVRDMRGDEELLRIRSSVDSGEIVGPSMVVSDVPLDGNPAVLGTVTAVRDAEAARAAVAAGKGDFIKVFSTLQRPAYEALLAEARARARLVCGHVPYSVSALQAARLGQRTIEHLTGVAYDCSPAGQRLRSAAGAALASPDADVGRFVNYLFFEDAAVLAQTHDTRRRDRLFEAFMKHGTCHVPTLVVLRAWHHLDDRSYRSDPRLAYLRGAGWETFVEQVRLATSGDALDGAKRLFELYCDLVRRMDEVGVKVAVGTDVNSHPSLVPGFSVHDELDLLADVGMSASAVLRAATLTAAEAMGLERTFGTVETGRVANLVLLRADPTVDVRGTREIDAVVAHGRLFDRAALDALLIEARQIAAETADLA